jgi:hypothetical protein
VDLHAAVAADDDADGAATSPVDRVRQGLVGQSEFRHVVSSGFVRVRREMVVGSALARVASAGETVGDYRGGGTFARNCGKTDSCEGVTSPT